MAQAEKHDLASWTLGEGYVSAAIRGQGSNHMAKGSENGMVTGDGLVRGFRGPLALAGKIGSRVFFVTDEAYAGLGTVAINGIGSVFKVRSLLFYIGAGQVNYDGAGLAGVIASSTLSFIRKIAGVYDVLIQYQAGHAQSSAPIIYAKDVPSAGKSAMSAAISVVVWRVCSITGQVSLMSLPSNVLTLSAQSVIVQFPLPDTNGQDIWGIGVPKIGFADLGNYYELPTSAGGEVLETVLSYTRACGLVTFTIGLDTAEVAGGVTSADVGRRLTDGTFDSWITEIVDPTHVKINDTPGASSAGAGTITHAIDGITRAVEISWSNGSLLEQNLAPDKAFPPVPGNFAGAMTDVLFLDADGIIYVSEPNQTGSMPPSNALFASGAAVLYLQAEEGVLVRFSRNTIGALFYVGGSPAVQYYEFRKHQGLKYAQNAGAGFDGRVCAWLGRPSIISSDLELDFSYANKVMPEFDGWNAQQTADMPIVFGYDGLGQYECWCLGKMVMAKYAPTGAWCSPTDLTGEIPGNIVAAVTVDHALYLSVVNGANLATYQYDAGTGSVMIIQTDDAPSRGSFDTVTEVNVRGRVDTMNHPVIIEVVNTFDDANPEPDPWDGQPEQTPTSVATQFFTPRQPNVMDARAHAIRITMTSEGGDCGVDYIDTKGASSNVTLW